MEYTAYRQIRSVCGIASILNTEFGSITPNKCSNCSHWVESVWKHNTTAYRQLRSIFGIPSIPNTGQYLGLMKSPKNEIMWNKYGIYLLFGVIRLGVIRNPTHSKSSN